MVMCAGIWWVWGDALLLLFWGIANWLGGFDVVVMRERGSAGKAGEGALQLEPIFIFGQGGICAGER